MGTSKHLLAGFSSYLIWGFVPVFFRQLTAYDDFEIILYRSIGSALLMVMLVLIALRAHRTDLQGLSRRDLWRMLGYSLLGGILLMINWLSYVYVVNHVSINAASFAYLILPIATAFLAYVILREPLTLWRWVGIGLSSVSCLLMAQVDMEQMLYVSAIALSYAFYLISQRHNVFVSRRLSLSIQLLFGCGLMLLVNPAQLQPSGLDFTFLLHVSVIVAGFTVLPLLLNLYALNGMQSSQLAFLIYVNPIVSFLTAVIWYGEALTLTEVTAYGFLLVAIVIFNWDLMGRVFARVRRSWVVS